jgi:hypothetical protein
MPLPIPPAVSPELPAEEADELRTDLFAMAIYGINSMSPNPETDLEKIAIDGLPQIVRPLYIHADLIDNNVSGCLASVMRDRVAACSSYEDLVEVVPDRFIPARAVLRTMVADHPPRSFNAYVSIRNTKGDYYHLAWESLEDVDAFRMTAAEPPL